MEDSGSVTDDSGVEIVRHVKEEVLSDDEEKDPMVKIYEELLASKKRTFQLEQRIRRMEQTVSEGDTLKVAEETIRATCHYLRESSGVIELQAARINNSEEKSEKTAEGIKAELVKFEGILEKVGKSTRNNRELKHLTDEIHKSGKIQNSDSKKVQSQLNKFAETIDTVSSATENFESEIKEVKIQLIEGQRSQEKNGIRQNVQLEELKDQLEKLSENQELKEIKNELREIKEKSSSVEKKVKRRLEKFEENQKASHVALENMMKEQLAQFMEDFKQMSSQIVPSDRKRSAVITPLSSPPAKKKSVIYDVKKSVENTQTKCIFCDAPNHESVKCEKFPSAKQRTAKLKEKNICTRCLAPNNLPEIRVHCPCPNEEKECQHCVVKWEGQIRLTNHHPILCEANAILIDLWKNVKIPDRNPNRHSQCIFCDDASHDSMYCRQFSSFYKREFKLRLKKICIRCLVPEGAEHNPCPKAEEACPNCDDGFPIPHDTTHHHLLVCKKIPSPDVLQELHDSCTD